MLMPIPARDARELLAPAPGHQLSITDEAGDRLERFQFAVVERAPVLQAAFQNLVDEISGNRGTRSLFEALEMLAQHSGSHRWAFGLQESAHRFVDFATVEPLYQQVSVPLAMIPPTHLAPPRRCPSLSSFLETTGVSIPEPYSSSSPAS